MKRLLLFLVLAANLNATARYVAKTGSNSNPGTLASPWLTIDFAVDQVVAGDSITVGCGTYTEYVTINSSHSGTSGARITLQAAAPGCIIIDGGGGPRILDLFDEVNDWTADGLILQNSTSGAVSIGDNDGPNTRLIFTRMWVRNIGGICTATSGGIVGFRSKYATSNVTVEQSKFQNIGRLASGESGCVPGNNNWQNHDHGLYMLGDGLTFRNNIFLENDNGWDIQTQCGSRNVTIAHNTFYSINPNRLGNIAMDYECNPGESGSANKVIVNNIARSAALAVYLGTCNLHPGTVAKNNIVNGTQVIVDDSDVTANCPSDFTLADNQTSTTASFEDGPNANFHLLAGSAGIDDGLASYATTDYDGTARDGSPDIGAFEFVNPTTTTQLIPISFRGVNYLITGSLNILITPVDTNSPPPILFHLLPCAETNAAYWTAAGYPPAVGPFDLTPATATIGGFCDPFGTAERPYERLETAQ